jgi:prepilin-type N-terminal cleavage/methylation domain-containing protein
MKRKEKTGFTLIEVVIVITIVMILSSLAIPTFEHLFVSERLQSVAWQTVQDLRTVKEDAILYQQNLRVYFCVDPRENRNFYLFETFQKDPLNNVHYNPGDTPDGKHFIKRNLKYNIFFGPHHPFQPLGWINGKQYYYLTFFSGAGSHFRGQPSMPDHITLTDKKSGLKFYVVVDTASRIRMSGEEPSP